MIDEGKSFPVVPKASIRKAGRNRVYSVSVNLGLSKNTAAAYGRRIDSVAEQEKRMCLTIKNE